MYVSYELTSLVVGTIGGGTGLPTQRECLEMMGCYGRVGIMILLRKSNCFDELCFLHYYYCYSKCFNNFRVGSTGWLRS